MPIPKCMLCVCRVLAPPGGASSNIFGSAADAEPKDAAQQHKKRFESSNIFGDPEAPNTPKANANKPADNSQSNIFGATGSGEAPRVNAKKQGRRLFFWSALRAFVCCFQVSALQVDIACKWTGAGRGSLQSLAGACLTSICLISLCCSFCFSIVSWLTSTSIKIILICIFIITCSLSLSTIHLTSKIPLLFVIIHKYVLKQIVLYHHHLNHPIYFPLFANRHLFLFCQICHLLLLSLL